MNEDALNRLVDTPIGLFYKNVDYINCALDKNVGVYDEATDSFGMRIGTMGDPYYNTNNYISWFRGDEYKNAFADYIDYISHVYYGTRITNLFQNFSDALVPAQIEIDRVGAVRGYDIVGAAVSTIFGATVDTYMGQRSNYYLSNTLITSAILNSERQALYDKSITNTLKDNLGLTNDNADRITKSYEFNEKGRVYVPLATAASPVDILSNYGNAVNYDSQSAWISTLNPSSLRFLGRSLFGEDVDNSVSFETYTDYSEFRDALNEGLRRRSYILNTIRDRYSSPKTDGTDLIPRYTFDGTPNTLMFKEAQGVYAEAEFFSEDGQNSYLEYSEDNPFAITANGGVAHGWYNSGVDPTYYDDYDSSDLISKTNKAFQNRKYRTLISRFHTSEADEKEVKETQTAISKNYGMSKGRNLLKVNPTTDNGYDNPYCRVWTYHHQYATLADTIRPFVEDGRIVSQKELGSSEIGWNNFAAQFEEFDGVDNGRKRLDKYSVLNKVNGTVNIAPTSPSLDGEDSVDVRNCMFSLENLAWKDYRDGKYGLSKEQRGPMGGRIMWFPPYDLNFNENINVQWNENSIIGRGENIYTYINTRRQGTLTFKILVDHPSVLDYYMNGSTKSTTNLENVNPLSKGEVDDIDSSEQAILRFFAGCDILKAGPIDLATNVNVGNYPQLPPCIEEEIPDTPQETVTEEDQLIFFVFYPNNYSAVDDRSGIVNGIKFLANGVGCQLGLRARLNETTNKLELADTELIEIPVSDSEYYIVDESGNELDVYGGYEIMPSQNSGQSCTDKEDGSNGSYIRSGSDKKGRFYDVRIKDSSNGNYYFLTSQYVNPNKGGGVTEWFYRVDRTYETQILNKGNYVDSKSFQLNTSNGIEYVKENLCTENEYNQTYSFIDVYCALDDKMHSLMSSRGIVDEDSCTKIKNLLSSYKVKSISGIGLASHSGAVRWNRQLNENRFRSIENWLKTYNQFKHIENAKFEEGTSTNGDTNSFRTDIGPKKSTVDDVNSQFEKLYRSAKVIITLEREKVQTVQETQDKTDSSVTIGDSGTVITTKYGDVNVPNKILEDINQRASTVEEREELLTQMLINNPYQFYNVMTPELKEELRAWQLMARGIYDEEQENEALDGSTERYDNEAYFFRNLKLTDPMLHHKITEKIKYFDPAFHSISPEGFNARLTFLQQCTRQGSTYSANENGMNTMNASNLAFGRPPIVVLRVGNFYCSKIIIESMSLNFENWDLNQEGIGVQPMLCDVSLFFTFLGGQDLSNPIPRLQNALSFNYYQNTSVYDNRAEMAVYDDENNGELKQFRGIKH